MMTSTNINNKAVYILIGLLVPLTVLVSYAVNFYLTPKVGYVISSRLVEEYVGMKEAQNLFQKKSSGLQANMDTLRFDFQKAVSDYQMQMPSLSQTSRRDREETLEQMKKNLQQYVVVIREQVKSEDEKITQGVLNQINSFVKLYADQEGYDIILGTTHAGSLLYGKDKLDVTDEILKELNKMYSPAILETLLEGDTTTAK
jgi:outer membrane protein